MAITYISSTDPFVGANHPFYPDILFRAGAYIKTQLELEHNDDGTHPNKEHGLIIEEDTYTGNGTPNRNITLTNSNLTPLWLAIYCDDATVRGADGYNVAGTQYWVLATQLEDITTTGQFTIGANDHTNEDTTTFYYVVMGYDDDTAWTGTASGSAPTWVEDGDTLDANVAGTGVLNQVAKHIEDMFLDEHNDDGTHKTFPFDFSIETGVFTPNGNDDRDITLDENIDIKAIWTSIYSPTYYSYWRHHKVESLAGDASFRTQNTGTMTNRIQSIGTGEFQVGDSLNAGTNPIAWCCIGE